MSSTAAPLPLSELPGHYIRRLQQIAVGVFMDETQAFGLTPVQFAALNAVMAHPGMDQRTLAAGIGFDTSTIGGVVDRLEARGWVVRQVSPEDRRARLLRVMAASRRSPKPILRPLASSMLRVIPARLRATPRAGADTLSRSSTMSCVVWLAIV